MKVIIAGSRWIGPEHSLTLKKLIDRFIEQYGPITEVVSGRARGVDTLGEIWAYENNIPVVTFPADWKSHGNAAGPIRNAKMGVYADAAVILWDGESKGSNHMVKTMKKINKPYMMEVINAPRKPEPPSIEDFY